MHTHIEYDAFDRETLRVFDYGHATQRLSQTYNNVDGLETRTLEEGETLLRLERYHYDARGRLDDYTCSGEHLPVDPYGQPISRQLFLFDGLDNLLRVITESPQGVNRANHFYENAADPAQLTRITNNAPAYPAEIRLEYDADGNLVRDEQARRLDYDALGRLVSVSDSNGRNAGSYRYDPLDRLASLSDDQGTGRRFYRGDELANLVQGQGGSTFMRAAGNLLAEQYSGDAAALLGCDGKNSVLREEDRAGGSDVAYSAYGYRSARPSVGTQMGFNGELDERQAGLQLPGKATGPTAAS